MNLADYVPIADDWERRATIRTRPRRLLEKDDKLIYPLCSQPLVGNIMAFLQHSGLLQTPSVAKALEHYLPVPGRLA